MKKFLLATLLFLPLMASALDNLGRIKIAEIERVMRPASSRHAPDVDIRYSSVLVEIEDDTAITDLEELGAKIVGRRENILLTFVPEDMLGELERIHKVTGSSAGRKGNLLLDKALPATNVTQVLNGTGFNSPYTGRGVTVGFSDLGFDPGHAAFRGRVKSVIHTVDTTATIIRGDLNDWTTDSPDDFHASHVGGILAGADASSPHQGVARGAEIVAATSTLDDVSILIGVEEVIAQAKASNQPAVVNLSLGSTMGPHDGSDLFCRYLDLCAEEAAIVLSAGNDGNTRMHIGKTLTPDATTVSAMVESTNWSNTMICPGYIDVWSSDARPLRVRFRVWDRYINNIVWESEWLDPSNEVITIDGTNHPAFGNLFEGVLMTASELSKYNNRYNLTIGVNTLSKIYYPGQRWSQNNIVVDIEGHNGAHLDICTEGNIDFFQTSTAYPWITSGTTDLSISSLACGFNTICVGSATTRDTTPLINGGTRSHNPFVEANTVSQFSSYGTTFDGRTLPHFCAPGAYIVSAFNRYALAKYPEMKAEMASESLGNPGHYYYAECGTSMASPHAAGIFALWLEANPALSGKELREIAIRTARFNGVDPANPRTGAGMIDAAAGLSFILTEQGIVDTVTDNLIEAWRESNGSIGIATYDPSEVRAEVYTITGSKIYEGAASEALLPSMTVIVRLTSKDFSVVRKL